MNLGKAVSIWFFIIFAESINGSLREFLIAPAIGERPAHQLGFFIGSGLILFIAWLTAPWLKADSFKSQIQAGGLWLTLIVVFEFGLGFARGVSWESLFSQYNPARGGLMSFGLVVLLLAPAFGAWMRARARVR